MTTTRRAEEPLRGTRRSPIATAVRWATGLALAVAVVGVLVLSVGTFTGWLSVQTVPTGSMEPAIHKGSAIVVDPVPADDVTIGDVIVFAAPTTGTMTVHRVAQIEPGESGPIFTTKGDANAGPDPWRLSVDGTHLQRVRMAVPVLGKILLALSAPSTRIVLAGLGALLALGFGLSHLWRRPDRRDEAVGTWDTALERMVHARPHPHLPQRHPHTVEAADGAPEDEAATIAEAVDAARRRRLDPLVVLLAESGDHTGTSACRTARSEPRSRVRRITTAGSTSVLAVVLLAGVAAWMPVRTANAELTATTAADNSVVTLTVPAKTGVRCSWDTTTNVTVAWSNPNPSDSAQVLVADTSGGTTITGATAAAGDTSVAYTPVAPLTTVRYLSTQAVNSTWTSAATAEMPTNYCRGAVRLFAGGGRTGFSGDGGPAVDAGLDSPTQTAEAPDGRVFIAGSQNDRIRVIDTNGIIDTFAGTGSNSSCSYTGPASGVNLNGPTGVAVDSAGNVYIADTGNDCIRRVDPSGTVSRFAGGGGTSACSSSAIAATSLSLSSPAGLAIDSTGALIVADSGRNCVRRISGATATRVAGGGGTSNCGTTTSGGVSLSAPIGVAADSAGNVYIADTNNDCVRKVSGSAVTAVAGGGNNRSCGASLSSTNLRLTAPEGVAVAADGSVMISDTGRRCIRRVTDTAVTPLAFTGSNGSNGDDGPALDARIRAPGMITVMADGDLLVPDRATNNNASDIRRIELS